MRNPPTSPKHNASIQTKRKPVQLILSIQFPAAYLRQLLSAACAAVAACHHVQRRDDHLHRRHRHGRGVQVGRRVGADVFNQAPASREERYSLGGELQALGVCPVGLAPPESQKERPFCSCCVPFTCCPPCCLYCCKAAGRCGPASQHAPFPPLRPLLALRPSQRRSPRQRMWHISC